VELAPFKVTDEGVTEHTACGGAPEQLRETSPLKPLIGAICMEKEPVCPAVTVAELEPAEPLREKSVPDPVKDTLCGLAVASSETTSEAVRAPVPVG
jgi:hypothetical protein